MIPAEELRSAAAKLRETAAKATPGPWEHVSTDDDGIRPLWVIGPPEDPEDGWTCREVVYFTDEMAGLLADVTEPEGIMSRADLDWMALMGPTVAHPLATWLESFDGIDLSEHAAVPDDYLHAVQVARAIIRPVLRPAEVVDVTSVEDLPTSPETA